MLRSLRRRRPTALWLGLGVSLVCAAVLPAATGEMQFLAANDAAMVRMMAGMQVRPRGGVDEDFVAMMVPHHQGAIEMAQAELRFGHNEQLKRLAQEIIVTQKDEIAAMSALVPHSKEQPAAGDAR